MEFKNNIVFSVIVHASIAVMTLAFAGRHAVLSDLPKNYIAVSLLGLADEKKFAPENRTGNSPDRLKKSETKPQKASPADGDLRTASPKSEKKIASSEYAMNDPSSEENASKEGRHPEIDIKQPLEKISGQAVSLQDRSAGLRGRPGDNHHFSTAASSGETASGNTTSKAMIDLQPGGGAGNNQSIVGQIKASIERAKIYPALARMRRQEGTVIAEFSINAKGLPQNIEIIKSSGFSLLDSATRDTILKASPFPVIRGTIEVPLTFILKKE